MRILPGSIGSVAIIKLVGELTAGSAFTPLHRLCGQLNRSPGNTVVVDLAGVERLDCAGIGELVRLHNCAGLHGVEMRLVNVGRLHRQMLEIFHLIEPLNVCSTMRAALRGCDPAAHEISFFWHLVTPAEVSYGTSHGGSAAARSPRVQ